ncbi:MAG: Shedu immune nuclease family protein [Eubacteriales bacterium]
MSVTFEKHDNELWICYSPEYGLGYMHGKFEEDEPVIIKHAFVVTAELLREENDEGIEEAKFCIGELVGNYIQLFPEVTSTDHKFFFAKDIRFKLSLFVAQRGISILDKIDDVIDKDFYVGGDWEKNQGISMDAYMELINKFPKTAELDKYARYRISHVLKEYYPECDRYEQLYDKYMSKLRGNHSAKAEETAVDFNRKIDLEQFRIAYQELSEMINDLGVDEAEWQRKIHNILRLLYPQYIYCVREVQFPGIGKEEKRPDFLLVDVHGFVDILEIKKATVRVLTQYRNNYVPSREFTGAIQQIEKYAFCLNSVDEAKEKVSAALSTHVAEGFTIQILNPQGILLLGRSNDFSTRQRSGFELIKRQYKHIADIMTYDDLLSRLKNIIAALSM